MDIPYQPPAPMSCDQVRTRDAVAIEQLGIPGVVLMENAGRNAAAVIYGELADPAASSVLILCGGGNNGGDGFVIARHLHNASVAVTAVLTATPERIHGDAQTNLRILERMGVRLIRAFEQPGLEQALVEIQQAGLIVDALLGTGSKGAPRGVGAELIRIANQAPARRIAIDIPSGLDADTGEVHEPCFRADLTISMVAAKLGFAAPSAVPVVGRVVVVDIGAPRR